MIKWTFWGVFALMVIAACNQNKTDNPQTQVSQQTHTEQEEHEQVELAIYMARLQRYMEKAYWSAKSNNEALHNFYIHEMEETMEHVQEAGITEDGVNISYNMLQFGLKSLETYESRIAEEGLASYPTHFQNLINGCNGCHLTSKKGMIKIQAPSVNHYSSQDFTP